MRDVVAVHLVDVLRDVGYGIEYEASKEALTRL
jgi:hypothetical protein